MRRTTMIALGLVAATLAFHTSVSLKSKKLSAQVVVPSVSFISASHMSPVWFHIDNSADDYAIEWEIQRPDGSLALDEFYRPAGVLFVPRGGAFVSLKLQLTERARQVTFSGERFHLKIREDQGRFEALSAIIVSLERQQSAGL